MDAEDAVDGVGRMPERGVSLVAEARVEVWTGAATAAVSGDLGFLCSFVPHNPGIKNIDLTPLFANVEHEVIKC